MPPFSLRSDFPLALYMEGSLGEAIGKMSYGILRYSPNPIACIIDSRFAGKTLAEVYKKIQPSHRHPVPIVGSVAEAAERKAGAFVLGIAPSGGRIPETWYPAIDEAVRNRMVVVNGMHELLGPRFPSASELIWDIRQEPANLVPATGLARNAKNKRVLMVGTDMAVGKMTAGLETWLRANAEAPTGPLSGETPGESWGGNAPASRFVATGQIGIVITGRGVPLDAVRVDYAAGAIEAAVVGESDADLVIIEGQGALNHPGSTSPLPLLRGSCPTHLILCCRAGQETLLKQPGFRIPPLPHLIRLYEDLAAGCGTFPAARVAAIAVNTHHLDNNDEAYNAIGQIALECGIPACDPVRQGASALFDAINNAPSPV